mmetsp:Transcript_35675/g.63764  ORF Transcript_35675/g.63764 Transcript_35675/m.63764 type:complete len:311 (+) Transcript_35675:920-1852(+)
MLVCPLKPVQQLLLAQGITPLQQDVAEVDGFVGHFLVGPLRKLGDQRRGIQPPARLILGHEALQEAERLLALLDLLVRQQLPGSLRIPGLDQQVLEQPQDPNLRPLWEAGHAVQVADETPRNRVQLRGLVRIGLADEEVVDQVAEHVHVVHDVRDELTGLGLQPLQFQADVREAHILLARGRQVIGDLRGIRALGDHLIPVKIALNAVGAGHDQALLEDDQVDGVKRASILVAHESGHLLYHHPAEAHVGSRQLANQVRVPAGAEEVGHAGDDAFQDELYIVIGAAQGVELVASVVELIKNGPEPVDHEP